jgi:hypothetical protein
MHAAVAGLPKAHAAWIFTRNSHEVMIPI